jgi:hypothetical protein
MAERINALIAAGDDAARTIGRNVTQSLAEARREAEQYRQAIMAGAIVGAPADPEAFA